MTPSNANTSGLEVVAWRWETPIPHVGDGTKWGWSFASHWSTPPSSLNPEPLVTAASAQARIAELDGWLALERMTKETIDKALTRHIARADAAEARADRLAKALRGLRDSCVRTPVGAGDGGTFIVSPPTREALSEATAALQQETQP